MSDNNDIECNINLLLTKYDGLDLDKSNSPDPKDMSANSILTRENTHLKNIIKSQKEMIDSFQIKLQDLSIQYNSKIDKLRDLHLQELNELHQQFRLRLKKEINSNIK